MLVFTIPSRDVAHPPYTIENLNLRNGVAPPAACTFFPALSIRAGSPVLRLNRAPEHSCGIRMVKLT